MRTKRRFPKLFTMTRSERIGTYVVLVAMALVLAVTAIYRSCEDYGEASKRAEAAIVRAEQAQMINDSVDKAKQDSMKVRARNKKINRKKKKTAKVERSDRPLHEVPQY